MTNRLRTYIRHNHLALLALVVAVVGVPTAWAVARNSVGSAQIKRNAVKHSDLADNAVKSPEVADGSLLSQDFAAGQLPAGEQGPAGPPGPASGGAGGDLTGSYPNPQVAPNAINGAKVADGSLSAADIDLSTLPQAVAYAEVTPSGTVRRSFNMSNASIARPSPAQAGIYCIKVDAPNAVATSEGTSSQLAGANVISAEKLADGGFTFASVGCPAGTHWVVQTFNLTPSPIISTDAYFTILLH